MAVARRCRSQRAGGTRFVMPRQLRRRLAGQQAKGGTPDGTGPVEQAASARWRHAVVRLVIRTILRLSSTPRRPQVRCEAVDWTPGCKPGYARAMRLIVFDVDGTLVDSQHIIIATMTAAFAAYDLPAPPHETVRRIVGLPLVEGVARLAPQLENLQHEAIAEAYRDGFQAARLRATPPECLFPGVRPMLEALASAGFTLGIATGKSRRGLDGTLERHGLTAFFETLQTGDQLPGKPHPAMLLRAIEAVGVAPTETAMIGDTSFDMAMACAAGALPIGVAWGYHPPVELEQAGAVHLVSACAEIAALFGAMVSGECSVVSLASGSSD